MEGTLLALLALIGLLPSSCGLYNGPTITRTALDILDERVRSRRNRQSGVRGEAQANR
jgi:hypothetical protein